MGKAANSTPPRVLLGMAVTSLGVLYAAWSTFFTSPIPMSGLSGMVANVAVMSGLVAGGLVIAHWGEPKPQGVAKRVSLVLFLWLAGFAIILAILGGYI